MFAREVVPYEDCAMRNYIKKNLRIEVVHKDGKLEIRLILGDEVVSSDYIDYSDVVRVAKFTRVD